MLSFFVVVAAALILIGLVGIICYRDGYEDGARASRDDLDNIAEYWRAKYEQTKRILDNETQRPAQSRRLALQRMQKPVARHDASELPLS